MDLNLQNKNVVITGGATGIGKATAMEFAREGANVTVCGRTLQRLETMKDECMAKGFDVDIEQVDVANFEELASMADRIAKKRGSIDIWINNAGVVINKPVMECTREEYEYVMRINLDGMFEGSRIAGRHMIAQGTGGVIINASSYAARIPHSESAVYAASKAGVSSFTKTFAASFAPYGIRVLAYVPGMIETEISRASIDQNRSQYIKNISLQRLGVPEDIAKPIVFLASDACSYITGVEIEIHGGKYSVQNTEYCWRNIKD